MHPALHHVTHDLCTDPDCEIHHIEVGLAETTVGDTELAFFIAGAQAMEMSIRRRLAHPATMEQTMDNPIYSRRDLLNAMIVGGRDILALAEGR